MIEIASFIAGFIVCALIHRMRAPRRHTFNLDTMADLNRYCAYKSKGWTLAGMSGSFATLQEPSK